MANDSLIEAIKLKETYLTDFLNTLSYLIEKQEAEEEEDAFQEQLRKAKRH